MFGKLRFRGKLALVVGIPLAALALLTLPSVFSAVDRYQRADEIGYSMRVATPVTALAFELQQERLLSLAYLFDVVDRTQLRLGTARVDDRIADVRYAAEHGELRDRGLPEPVSTAVDAAEKTVAEWREQVLSRSAQPDPLFFEYSFAIDQLIDSLRLLDGADLSTRAAQNVAVLEASLGMNEVSAQASTLLLVVAATGSPFAAVQYAAVLQPMGDHLNQYLLYASREQAQLRDQMEQAYIQRDATGEGMALGFDPFAVVEGQTPAELFPHVQSLGQLGRFVEGKIIADVLLEVEAQRQSALRNAYLIALGALLVVLAVVATTAILARRVVRPLLGLTESANRVALVADAELARIADDESTVVLPEPIRIDPQHVKARDEIGDLGRAFERVQQFAIQLVERQMISRRNVALMFGYLGRRTQNLVGRQLDLIDELERNETDPDRLLELYRLDHVSSRLRRNASSLVVLSGAQGPDEYTVPIPLADIVRLALGEIEDYDRVDVDVPPAIAIVPAVIGDLVLLLAELMENATTFSPPHTRVTVTAVATGRTGPSDQVVEVLVVDHGIGVPAERMAEENARLARRERLDLAPTEVLGLFVVGRLARRHGLRVELSETPGGGVTALVGLYRRHVLPGETVTRAIPSPGGGDSSGDRDSGIPGPRRVPALGGFDAELLNRATRTLETGQPWNAFAMPDKTARPESPAPESASPGSAPMEPVSPGSAPATESPESTSSPGPDPVSRLPVSGEPGNGKPENGGPGTGEPGGPGPAASNGDGRSPTPLRVVASARPVPPSGGGSGIPGLRRRKPGASLGSSSAAARTTPGRATSEQRRSGLDPALARELVEQLQTGVRRALNEIESQNRRDEGIRGERDDK